MVWGQEVQPGAQAAAAGAAPHVATGAAGCGRKPRRGARPRLAGARASGLGAGSARAGSRRGAERGASPEPVPRYRLARLPRSPGAAHSDAAWPWSPAAGAGGGRLEGAAAGEGAEAAELFYLQVSRTPRPCSAPRRPERRGAGEAGAPGTPGSLPAAATAAGVRVGVGPARVSPGADAAPRARLHRGPPGGPGAPPPRVQRALGLGMQSSPSCVWLPGGRGVGAQAPR